MTYRQVELLCPQVHENKNSACVGLFDYIVAVILPPITKRLERAFTCQSSLVTNGTQVVLVNLRNSLG
jgi:hypothetical protein